MIKIKRLSECTFNQAVTAWNKGFEGYFVNATTTLDNFLTRFVNEGLSAECSVVAFDENEPVGLVLNGFRTINGQKVAWNGGTGVAKSYRRQGVGKALMEETLKIYEDEGVEIATLESISENDKAIALYEGLGYQVVDRLVFLEQNGTYQGEPFQSDGEYGLIKAIPQQVQLIPFYKDLYPWQTQWQSVKGGESLIAVDSNHEKVGYAIYRQTFNEDGTKHRVSLFQCEADPNREDRENIVRYLLKNVFGPYEAELEKTVVNLPISSKLTFTELKNAQFTEKIAQVYMMKSMK